MRLLAERSRAALAAANDAAAAAEAIYQVVETTLADTVPADTVPADDAPADTSLATKQSTAPETFNLVIASCVLSQLHNGPWHEALRLMSEYFPSAAERFRSSQRTADVFLPLARTIEARFVDRLAAWTAPGGRIYLSESVQMCFVEPDGAEHWSTEGTLRMTRTTDLADYLDRRFHIEQTGRWNWLVDADTLAAETGRVKAERPGRLFDVQGLLLSLAN